MSQSERPRRQRKPSGGLKSPKVERKRTVSQTSNKANKNLTDPSHLNSVSKVERRRSTSVGEGKHQSQDDVVMSHHSYRMHRVKFFEYEPQSINCIACDNANNRLALSRSDGSIEIWTVGLSSADLCQQYVIRNESGTSIEALLWHNSILFRAGLDGDLVEYDMQTLNSKRCVPCHAGAIWCLSLSADNSYIAAGTEEGCIVIFEYTGEGFQYMKSLQKQEERMLCLDWHISGDVIVTGGIDNIRLWSVESGHALQRITIARQSPQKPTIVWAIAILRDRTIVSGDSSGKLTFWNGKHGTQIKMFNCHRADILSIAVSQDETQVYAAGIDSVLVQFVLSPVSASSDWLVWQRSTVRAHHSHDVRAVVVMDRFVISGGVDCSLVVADFEEKLKYKTIPLPQQRLVHVAKGAQLLLLQYTNYLQLWTLGVTNTLLADREEGSCELPLSSSPVNLLELRSKSEEHIVCSAISHSACWLAYCDRTSLRLFNLTLSQGEMLAPKLSASRFRGLPTTISHLPIRAMQFSGDGKLILGYVDCSLKVLMLKETNSLPQITNIINSPAPHKGVEHGILRLIQTSQDGERIVTSDSLFNLLVYEFCAGELKMLCRLPREDILVTALAFSPSADCLSYTLSSHKVIEYNLVRRCYTTPPSVSIKQKSKSRVFNIVTKVLNLQYARHDSTLILIQDALGLRVYDTKSGKLSSRSMYENRYLMHFEELDDDFALVVERSPLSLSSALPQALAKKQFGT
ncbi:U3 small nucleolar RNA-associated protein 4 homolog [Watersipora subatra]|uniref:U3 small nucleolar RNA-associated protein 4 homolog n=1 Tax=Watersipora subatra TaxID=2589382 RepID=UPI00355BFC9C